MWSSGTNIVCWEILHWEKWLSPSMIATLSHWPRVARKEVASTGKLYQNSKMLQVEAITLMALIAAELQVVSWMEIEVVHYDGCPIDLAWEGSGVPATSSWSAWSRRWEGRLKHRGLIESYWRSNCNTRSPQVHMTWKTPMTKWSLTETLLCPSVYILTAYVCFLPATRELSKSKYLLPSTIWKSLLIPGLLRLVMSTFFYGRNNLEMVCYGIPLPKSVFREITMVAWNWQWWENF